MAENRTTEGVCLGHCGYKGPGRQDDGRCPTCGSELIPLYPGPDPADPDPPNTVRCPKCNSLECGDSNFCPMCGTRLKVAEP
jgi:hypothetical protein